MTPYLLLAMSLFLSGFGLYRWYQARQNEERLWRKAKELEEIYKKSEKKLWRKAKELEKAHKKEKARKRRLSDQTSNAEYREEVLRKAKSLLAADQRLAASKLLCAADMTREAIDLLTENGYIRDAAQILLNIGKPDRAGNIYSLHACWKEAAECFSLAGMPLEEANCLRSNSNYIEAAWLYKTIDQKSKAAECYIQSGEIELAGELYLEAKDFRNAYDIFKRIDQVPHALESLKLNFIALNNLKKYILSQHDCELFARILIIHHQMEPLLKNLLTEERLSLTTSIAKLLPQTYRKKIIKSSLFSKAELNILSFALLQADTVDITHLPKEKAETLSISTQPIPIDDAVVSRWPSGPQSKIPQIQPSKPKGLQSKKEVDKSTPDSLIPYLLP